MISESSHSLELDKTDSHGLWKNKSSPSRLCKLVTRVQAKIASPEFSVKDYWNFAPNIKYRTHSCCDLDKFFDVPPSPPGL